MDRLVNERLKVLHVLTELGPSIGSGDSFIDLSWFIHLDSFALLQSLKDLQVYFFMVWQKGEKVNELKLEEVLSYKKKGLNFKNFK